MSDQDAALTLLFIFGGAILLAGLLSGIFNRPRPK
jgi:hypothetical protein